MVDDLAKKNSINDVRFEKEYYQKYVTNIKSFQKYIDLEEVVRQYGLHISFSYAKDESLFYTQYEIGFEICDGNGNVISVPKESKFWDHLYNLLSFFPVITYHKLTKKIFISEIDKKELATDCQLFIDYLRSAY
jgi:hypothetical protein